MEGRIHTCGTNVALGYLEDGSLSQKDFVTIADENGVPHRAFRTGDMGHFRNDGTIMFAGRVAGYVKIRGVRVSLPDIENELVRHPFIRQVLAVDYGDERSGDATIGVLYVRDESAQITTAEFRDFARQNVPESHVPSRFIEIDALPLSSNGKPDRKRAREQLTDKGRPEGETEASIQTAALPALPKKVLDIYLQVLGHTESGPIDRDTDFISLGLRPSHLKSISLQLRQAFDVDVSPKQLLGCRNTAHVEQLISARTQ